jgi:hypothetical protein
MNYIPIVKESVHIEDNDPDGANKADGRRITDLVADFELETDAHSSFVQHAFIKWEQSGEDSEAVIVYEKWLRKEELGRGSFGTVYREICQRPVRKDGLRVRAVKHIRVDRKPKSYPYRELEAMVEFSQDKV